MCRRKITYLIYFLFHSAIVCIHGQRALLSGTIQSCNFSTFWDAISDRPRAEYTFLCSILILIKTFIWLISWLMHTSLHGLWLRNVLLHIGWQKVCICHMIQSEPNNTPVSAAFPVIFRVSRQFACAAQSQDFLQRSVEFPLTTLTFHLAFFTRLHVFSSVGGFLSLTSHSCTRQMCVLVDGLKR